jgi:hypothetical protein
MKSTINFRLQLVNKIAESHFISLGTSQNSIPLLFHIPDLHNVSNFMQQYAYSFMTVYDSIFMQQYAHSFMIVYDSINYMRLYATICDIYTVSVNQLSAYSYYIY